MRNRWQQENGEADGSASWRQLEANRKRKEAGLRKPSRATDLLVNVFCGTLARVNARFPWLWKSQARGGEAPTTWHAQ